jgi:hypothetical protein
MLFMSVLDLMNCDLTVMTCTSQRDMSGKCLSDLCFRQLQYCRRGILVAEIKLIFFRFYEK